MLHYLSLRRWHLQLAPWKLILAMNKGVAVQLQALERTKPIQPAVPGSSNCQCSCQLSGTAPARTLACLGSQAKARSVWGGVPCQVEGVSLRVMDGTTLLSPAYRQRPM